MSKLYATVFICLGFAIQGCGENALLELEHTAEKKALCTKKKVLIYSSSEAHLKCESHCNAQTPASQALINEGDAEFSGLNKITLDHCNANCVSELMNRKRYPTGYGCEGIDDKLREARLRAMQAGASQSQIGASMALGRAKVK